jgi:DNA primase
MNLEAAEAACQHELSEANWARLQSILAELEKAEGTEALVEGFGSQSGRPARNF